MTYINFIFSVRNLFPVLFIIDNEKRGNNDVRIDTR